VSPLMYRVKQFLQSLKLFFRNGAQLLCFLYEFLKIRHRMGKLLAGFLGHTARAFWLLLDGLHRSGPSH
ncbi:MAG: hypothetical protein ACPIOQ_39920, partial [Promethearchaeia archaeon]